ncbi:MAG: TetR/AcrR family transcriptional regulator [Candidatus Promineifilaceae bacterium]
MDSEGQTREQQILTAAFDEFAKKGFKGATIKNIAKAAELQSPSLIYWYFPTKEELFQAVLSNHIQVLQFIADPKLHMEKPPDVVLPQLAHTYIKMVSQPEIQKLFRLFLAELVKRPELANLIGGKIFLRVLTFLETYFTHQVELGRLRPHDVKASAKAFMGLLVPTALGQVVFSPLATFGPDDEHYMTAAIEIFLSGLRLPSQQES